MAESTHARKPVDVGEIYRAPSTSSVAAASDLPCLDVTSESSLRNPLREICTVGSVREETSRWCHGRPKRARSWKRRTQPRKAYSLSGLLYSERSDVTTTVGSLVLFIQSYGSGSTARLRPFWIPDGDSRTTFPFRAAIPISKRFTNDGGDLLPPPCAP